MNLMEASPLPQSPEVEEEILGSILTDTCDDTLNVIDGLSEHDFASRSNRIIFKTIKALHLGGMPFDVITLTTKLKDEGVLDTIGGNYHLSILASKHAINFLSSQGIQILKEKTRLRKLLELSNEIGKKAVQSCKSEDIVSQAEAKLVHITDDVADENLVGVGVDSVARMIDVRMSGQKVYGILTGIKAFDEVFHGVQPSQYYVVAARPSDGKTSILDQSCIQWIKDGIPFLYVPMESSEERIIGKIACKMCRLSFSKFLKGELNESQLGSIRSASEMIRDSKMIMKRPVSSADALRAVVNREIRKNDIKIFAIDYLQKFIGSGGDYKNEISNTSQSVQNICVETGVSAYVLCQLNRESIKDSRPRMAHLKESGQIEQDADNICLLWSEKENHELAVGEAKPMILTIEKNKDGITGVDQKLDFDRSLMIFQERSELRKYGI